MRCLVVFLFLVGQSVSASAFRIGFTSLALDKSFVTMQLEQHILLQLEAMTDHVMSLERQQYQEARNKALELVRLQQEISAAQLDYDRLRLAYQPDLKLLLQKKTDLNQKKKALSKAELTFTSPISAQPPIEVQRFNEPYSLSLVHRYPLIDVWVRGHIQLLNTNTLYVMIELYDTLTAESKIMYRGSVSPANVLSLSREVVDGGRALLLGRDWAALEVVGESLPTTMAMQWGQQRIRFPMSFENLVPGPNTLQVAGLGHERIKQELTLPVNQRTRYVFLAEESLQDHRLIESVPKGARIYVDGLYVGVSPLLIPIGQHQVVSAHLDEHLPVAQSVGKLNELRLVLGRDYEAQSAFIKAQQKNFRISSGFFTFSLLGPLILYNISLDYRQKSAKLAALGDAEGALRAQDLARSFNYGLWGSAAVSGGLLGLSIYHLYGYVESSEPTAKDEEDSPVNSD